MRNLYRSATLALSAALAGASSVAHADNTLKCVLSFEMHGWSAFYKTASGHGTVRCSNGESLHVKLEARGGGLTVGKSVEEGHGQFSPVAHLRDVLGSYAAAEAQAGAINSAQAQVMTKGEVSLALSGKGHGWELGISFGELKIERE